MLPAPLTEISQLFHNWEMSPSRLTMTNSWSWQYNNNWFWVLIIIAAWDFRISCLILKCRSRIFYFIHLFFQRKDRNGIWRWLETTRKKKGKHLNIQQFPVPACCAKRWILLSWIADVTEHFDKFYLKVSGTRCLQATFWNCAFWKGWMRPMLWW